jgi:hypothetical protein
VGLRYLVFEPKATDHPILRVTQGFLYRQQFLGQTLWTAPRIGGPSGAPPDGSNDKPHFPGVLLSAFALNGRYRKLFEKEAA